MWLCHNDGSKVVPKMSCCFSMVTSEIFQVSVCMESQSDCLDKSVLCHFGKTWWTPCLLLQGWRLSKATFAPKILKIKTKPTVLSPFEIFLTDSQNAMPKSKTARSLDLRPVSHRQCHSQLKNQATQWRKFSNISFRFG